MFRETRNNTRVKGFYCIPWTHKKERSAQTSAETGNNRTEPSDSELIVSKLASEAYF